jgi:23S rRNA (adenine2503-C2)-methyltransferase
MSPQPIPFTGVPFPELAELLESPARAKAALRWLYRSGLPNNLPDRIPGVAHAAWERVRQSCCLPQWSVLAERRARDGTVKLAVDFAGRKVETVLIPGPQRSTVCVSSQSGCTRRCAFCATGRLGFRGNLTAAEIVAQYILAQKLAPPGRPARNVVFMGMGEPMDNLDAVLQAIVILTRSPYPALSPAHVTVSTTGVVPGIERFLRESDARLALSLNATTDELRQRLMPHARTWPLADVLDTIRRCAPQRDVFVEYLLIAGINDTPEDAERLPRLLDRLNVRVNLIPFNQFPDSDFQASDAERIHDFRTSLTAAGLRCLIRHPHGAEIGAACGQLAMRL